MDRAAVRKFSSLFLMKAYVGTLLISVIAIMLLNTNRDKWEIDAIFYACDVFIKMKCSDDSIYIYEYLYMIAVIVCIIYTIIDIILFKSLIENNYGYIHCLKGAIVGFIGFALILYFIFIDHRSLSIFIGIMGFNEVSLIVIIFSIFHMYGVVSLYLYLIMSIVQYKISERRRGVRLR